MRRATLVGWLLIGWLGCSDNGGTGGTGGTGGMGDAEVVIVPPDANPTVPPDGSTAFQNDAGTWICNNVGQEIACQCANGMDDDSDTKTDYPNDPDCVGYWDDTELYGSGCGTSQCTNCLDDDGDGRIDTNDPECTGPLDNREDTFATGIPGDNLDCKQDCFFDGNSGAGDDGCEWNAGCDPLIANKPGSKCKMPNNPSACPTMQATICTDSCRPLTPNGCDCFGCCTIFDSSGTGHDVRIDPNSQCNTTTLSDPNKCPACTKYAACENTCDLCEYCLGRAPDPSCGSGGTDAGTDAAPMTPACPYNQQSCDPALNNCPSLTYCLTGCCVPYGIQ